MSQTAIYDASLVTRVLRSRTLYAYYVLNSEFNNRTGGVRPEQQIPVSELVVLQRQLGEMIEFRNNKVLIPFEFNPSFGPGGQPVPPPFASTFTLTFQASPLLPVPPPAIHNGMDAYFYYTGALQTVDWGDGTVEDVGETTPVAFAYKNHTYAAGGTYTITVVAQDLIGLWLFNLIHTPGPWLPNPADNSQPGMLGVNLAGSPQLEDFDCRYTGLTALTGLGASTMLDTLRCTGCAGLTALSTTAWPVLTVLECGATGISALDLTANVALQELLIDGAPVTSVELSACASTINSVSAVGCTALAALTNSGVTGLSALAAVNVSGCSTLGVLALPGATALSILNITGATALTVLFLEGAAGLTGTLDLTGRASLGILNLAGTGLTGVTLTGCAVVSNLVVTGSSLTALDVTPCTGLITLLGSGCAGLVSVTGLSGKTALTGVNMANCPALLGFGIISGCTALTSITVTGCTSLIAFAINTSPNLAAVVIGGCSSLSILTIDGSKITTQSFTGCTNLGAVYMPNNTLLTTFNTVPNAGLQYIVLSGCTGFTSALNVSTYTGLVGVNVSGSGVTALTGLAGKTALTAVNVAGCAGFTGMNVAGCSSLITVDALSAAGFDPSEIDGVLAQMAVNSTSINGGNVDLRVAGGVSPSPTGWAYYSAIVSNVTWTVLVNGSPPAPTSSFSFTSTVVGASQFVSFDYWGDSVTLDWGDGTIETIPNSGGYYITRSHIYSGADTYVTNIVAYGGAQINGIKLLTPTLSPQLFITAINVANASELIALNFDGTGLTTVDFTGATALDSFSGMNCPSLTSINMSGATNLTGFSIMDCPGVTSLNLTANVALITAVISGSGISIIDFTTCPNMLGLYAIGCPNLTAINGLRNKTALISVDITGSPKLASVDVTGCTTLQQINAANCNLDQATVDTMLIQCSANKNVTVYSTGTVDVQAGTNAVPSLSDSAVQYALYNLQYNPLPWVVFYNTGSNSILAYSYWTDGTPGTPPVYGSSDSGSNWGDAGLTLPFDSNTSSEQLFRYGGGRLLAVSSVVAPATSKAVAVSTDRGSTWTLSQPNPIVPIACSGGLDWNGATFLIGMRNLLVTFNTFYTSADGINWQPAAPITTVGGDLFIESFGIAAEYGANPGRWAVSGKPYDLGPYDVYVSQNADATVANWQQYSVFGGSRQSIVMACGTVGGVIRWIACGINVSPGADSQIYYGDDLAGNGTGITWISASPLPGVLIYDITFNGTYFVAVGSGGTIVTSMDGISWTVVLHPELSTFTLSKVIYDNVLSYWLISILEYNASGQVYQIADSNPNTAGNIIGQPSYPANANMRDLVILA